MASNPEVTVAAIIERDNRFLMVEERIGGRLVLNRPGTSKTAKPWWMR